MERVILHCDANSFYASCELVDRPALRGMPFAVCGSTEERHGIVLAATREAKLRGVKTAMVNWEAKQWCPELITVAPNYQRYIYFSKRLRWMYEQYTDRVEPFGLDECWLDVSNLGVTLKDGLRIADRLRRQVREELGITISVGVSFNKAFAKLGSDMKKPDGSTVISKGNYRQKVWPLPVEELLGVGERVRRKLESRYIKTIGDLAAQSPQNMQTWLGKMGIILQRFAAGEDATPVMQSADETEIKSVGNSITAPRDMYTLEDAHCVLYVIADSVASRLREIRMRGKCVSLMVRDSQMHFFSAQKTVDYHTAQAEDIVLIATEMLHAKGFCRLLPYRSLGITVGSLQTDTRPVQTDMLGRYARQDKLGRLSQAVDHIHARYGDRAIERGLALANPLYNTIVPKTDHVVHPVGFLR
ncbi:MAG: DNA polymerase IV [Eubacteriales bacterium]|nr:DNA polymerase IV [Eubacteriales bacterium]